MNRNKAVVQETIDYGKQVMLPTKLDFRIRILGIYLMVCSTYQIAVYRAADWFGGMYSVIYPRFGFLLLGEKARGPHWVSSAWLLCLGLGLLVFPRRLLLLAYVVSECILAFPTGLYGLASIFGDLGHLTAGVAELLILFAVFIAFTVLPLCAAVYFYCKLARSIEAQPG